MWETTDATVIASIQDGTVTEADLTAAGAVQHGVASDDYPCSDNGNDCDDIYAVAIFGVLPSTRITWFQAQQACANAGKHLLTNAEWQMAAAGTPDPGTDNDSTDCNITNDGSANDPVNTGSRSSCVSRWGAFDMVGNVWEFVADWIQDNSDSDGGDISTVTYGNDLIFGVDEAFPETDRFPAALVRGGFFGDGSNAGVFALAANAGPSDSRTLAGIPVGFRCGR